MSKAEIQLLFIMSVDSTTAAAAWCMPKPRLVFIALVLAVGLGKTTPSKFWKVIFAFGLLSCSLSSKTTFTEPTLKLLWWWFSFALLWGNSKYVGACLLTLNSKVLSLPWCFTYLNMVCSLSSFVIGWKFLSHWYSGKLLHESTVKWKLDVFKFGQR